LAICFKGLDHQEYEDDNDLREREREREKNKQHEENHSKMACTHQLCEHGNSALTILFSRFLGLGWTNPDISQARVKHVYYTLSLLPNIKCLFILSAKSGSTKISILKLLVISCLVAIAKFSRGLSIVVARVKTSLEVRLSDSKHKTFVE
jgi:hypothetical protein